MNKKYIRFTAFVAVALIILLLIFPEWLPFNSEGPAKKSNSSSESANSTASKGIVIDAEVVQANPFTNDIVLAGSLLANESVDLASETAGKVAKIYFKEGQYVKKGQLLLTTNFKDLQADLKRLSYTKKLKEQAEERQKKLLKSEAISQEEYDMTFTELKTTEAEIESLKAQIEKSKIAAPFSGYIGLRYVSEGSYITTSSQIASLYNTDPIKIEFSVPSRYSSYIKKGDEINFTSEGEDKDRIGKIYAIEPQIDPVTRTLKVRAMCSNESNSLIPGQFVRVKLSLESNPDAILIPTTAIMPQADGHLIFLISNGQAYKKEVELGIRTARKVEVVSGLNAGDTIATAGVPQLKDRVAISIKNLESRE